MVIRLSTPKPTMFRQNMQFRGLKPKNNQPVSYTAGMPPREPATKSANMTPEEQLKQLEQEQLDSIKQQDEQEMLDRMTDEAKKELEAETNPEPIFGLSD